MIILEFIKHHMPYSKGAIAGFTQAQADQLVKAGVAIEYKQPEAEPVKPALPERTPATQKMVKK